MSWGTFEITNICKKCNVPIYRDLIKKTVKHRTDFKYHCKKCGYLLGNHFIHSRFQGKLCIFCHEPVTILKPCEDKPNED